MTREELVMRWQMPWGDEIRTKILGLLRTREDCLKEIDEIVANIPGASEIVATRRFDLRGIDLTRLDLHGADLAGACLDYANLDGCILTSAYLHYCMFNEASLVGLHASLSMMTGIVAHRARFDGADLSGADLLNADLKESSFRNANLEGIGLINGWADRTDFRGANLAKADLAGTSLATAIFDEAAPVA